MKCLESCIVRSPKYWLYLKSWWNFNVKTQLVWDKKGNEWIIEDFLISIVCCNQSFPFLVCVDKLRLSMTVIFKPLLDKAAGSKIVKVIWDYLFSRKPSFHEREKHFTKIIQGSFTMSSNLVFLKQEVFLRSLVFWVTFQEQENYFPSGFTTRTFLLTHLLTFIS